MSIRIVALAFSLLAFPVSAVTAAPELWLRLGYVAGETSKDSHHRKTTAAIDGRKLTYSGPYGKCGRGGCEEKTVTLTLTADQTTAIRNLVVGRGLDKRFNESHKTGGTIGSYVDLNLWVGRKRGSQIHIAGMTNAWGKKKESALSPKARKTLIDVESLVSMLRRIVQAKDASFR